MASELERLVKDLDLQQHPEGGWYRETYRSPVKTNTERGERNLATLIYYLLPAGVTSRVHRVQWDEIWAFQGGGTLTLMTHADGKISEQKLGIVSGASPQILIPAHTWFNAKVDRGEFVLAACMVAPGFDFVDLDMA